MKFLLYCILSISVCLTVFGQNTPVIETIEDLSIPEGMVHDLSVSASDPDAGDELTFQVYNLPHFASFSQVSTTTGNINIQTGFADAGQYTITVRVTDLQLNYAEESFILTIEDNQPKASTQELLNFNYTINAGGSLDFYVYYPQNYDAYPNDQPVLIYLHGLGMRGGSPTKLISSENDGAPSHYVANGGDLPMMVITPHQPVWIGGVSYSTWNIPLLKELIEHVKSTFNVDQDRIYLTGFSNGGQSAWQYAIEYKEDLAALIPVAGRTNLTNQSLYGMNLQDPEYACQISDLPTNVWHSFNDEVINIGHATNMVESINNCNPAPDPVPLLHVLSGVSHGGTRPHVYGNITGPDNIYNWMLSYVRGVGFVDTDPPVFVDGTPSVSNVLDVSFDYNASIDEVGTVYYALYSSNENPNIEEIISGSGSSIITYGSLSNVQSSSRSFSDLDPETTYYLWTVAEDAVSPPNRQASPTLLTVTTQEEIIDDQPPVFETQPTILDVGAGSVRLNLEINEEGIIYWGLFDPAFVPSPGDLLSSGNGIQFGSFGTNGSTESLEISGLFKGTDYKLGVLAVDDEPNPNEQATVFTLTFSTDSLEEGVIPDRKYLINITAGSSPSNEFGWNDLGLDGFSGSKQFSGLVDSQEIPGQLGLTAYNGEEGSSINDIADNGSGYANGSIFPPEVVRYGAYTTGWGIIDFINLDPDKYYSFNILGSRNASGSRTTDFLLGGETLSLESVNNLSSTVTFEKLSPPSNGIMRLRFDPGSSNWGYINLIEVEEYNQLSGDTLSPVIQPDVSVAQIDDLEVEITWAGSTDPDLAGYSLYRSLDAEPSSDLLTDLLQGNIQGNTYLDTAVTVGQQYFYWVVAIDSAGNYSSRSALDSVLVISSDTIAPQQPVGLVAEIIEADRITLSWDANPEPDISGYMIARGLSVDFDFESEVIDEYVNSVTYLDTLLSDETTYYYKIKAVDLSGNQSVASEVLQVTTLDGTPPALPDTVLLTATTDAIEVSWSTSSSPDVAGYNLFRTIEGTSIVYDTVANNPIEALTKTLYIPFENNLSDQSGNGIISSASGGLTFTDYNPIEGDFSGQFDGVDDQIILDEGDVYVHESFSTKSVLLWVNATTISGVQDIYDEGGSTNGMGLRINEGMLEGVVQDNHNIQMVSTPIDIGVWTHVALVYDQGTLMIYKNGELSDSQSTPYSSISTHSDAGGLGGTISSNAFDVVGNSFNGRIDEFMVIPSGLGSTTLSSYYKYYNPVIDTIAVSIDTLLASDLGVYDTVFVDDTPEAGIEYGYFLSATDSSGNESAYSVPVYGMLDSVTFDPPSVPQNLQTVLSGTDVLDLSWDEVTTAGLSHYTLYRSTSPFTTVGEADVVVDSVLTPSYSDVSLTQETTYYYRVSATNIEGETSGLSGMVSYLIPDTESPLAPVNLVVTGDTARVSISWQDGGSSDVVGYNIYRNVGAAPTVDSAYFYAQASGTSYTDFGVSELTTYYYVVAAYDEVANESAGSAPGVAAPQNVTAPSSPAGVISTLTGDTEITINWDANTESDLQGYRLYRGMTPGFAIEGNLLVDNVTDLSYIDEGLEYETTYYYYVTAFDVAGNESIVGQQVSSTTNVEVALPTVPQNLQVILSGTDVLDLSWDEVSTPGLSHYSLYRSTSPFTTVGEADVVVDSVLTTSYSDVSLTQETTYYYRVSATNIEGETSGLSGMVSYLIPDTESPLAPVNLVVTGDTARVSISWQDGGSSDVVGYNIYRNVGAAPTVDSAYFYAQASGTSYTDFGVSELTTYYYVVAAYDEVANESAGSAPGVAAPQNVTAPSSPAGVISTLTGDTEITINWDANTESDLQGYRLYRGMTPGFAIEGNLLVDNVTDLSYIDEGLEYETTYYYYVTAFDVAGNESIVGQQVSSTTNVEVALPTVPQNLQVILSGTDVLDLSWDEVSTPGLSHYSLYRSTSPFTTAGEADVVVDSVLTTSYSDVSLTQETTYYYRVSATNIEGETSGLSGMVSYLIPDTESPLAPVNLVVAGDTARVSISWQDGGSSDVVGYNIYRNVGAAPTVDSAYFYAQASGTSYIDFGVSELTTYYYVVAAYDEVANESVGSAPGAAAPQNVTAPSSPAGVISTLTGDTEITINWDANTESDLQGYRLYRGMTPGFAIEGNLLVDNVTDLSYIDEGLEYETTYYYYVTAFDVAGNESIVGLQASSTTNVEPVVSDVVQTVLVNLTETGSNSGQLSWNDLAVENIDKAQTFSLLTDSLGVPTTIAFTVYNGQLGSTINNVADNGGSLNGGVYPDLVARYGAYTTNRGVMAFQNLDINHEYDITLLSGRAGSGSRITTIEVNQEEVQYVESIDNNQNTVTFRSVTPAPDGTIEIRFSKENSNWGYLNAVVLHKHDAGMAGARVLSSTEGEHLEDVYEEEDTLEDIAINTELDNQSTDFTLFPNPVVDKLVIRFEKPLSKSTTLIVRSINGQKLAEIFLREGKSNFEIDLSYPTGIYHLTIPLDKGMFISEKVFVE